MTNEEELDASVLLMHKMGPAIFEKGILSEIPENEKEQLAKSFAMSEFTNFETLKKCIELAAIVASDGRQSDADIIMKYAKLSMNHFLNNRVDFVTNGISIQHVFEGEVINSIGHALNEGLTELFTINAIENYQNRTEDFINELDRKSFGSSINQKNEDGTYLLEVKAARMLCNVVDEKVVYKAYFSSDMVDWYAMEASFNKIKGGGSFMNLLHLSDNGNWRQAFSILK